MFSIFSSPSTVAFGFHLSCRLDSWACTGWRTGLFFLEYTCPALILLRTFLFWTIGLLFRIGFWILGVCGVWIHGECEVWILGDEDGIVRRNLFPYLPWMKSPLKIRFSEVGFIFVKSDISRNIKFSSWRVVHLYPFWVDEYPTKIHLMAFGSNFPLL